MQCCRKNVGEETIPDGIIHHSNSMVMVLSPKEAADSTQHEENLSLKRRWNVFGFVALYPV